MEEEKRRFVDEMYSLRAGLSAILVEKEKIAKIYAQCETDIKKKIKFELDEANRDLDDWEKIALEDCTAKQILNRETEFTVQEKIRERKKKIVVCKKSRVETFFLDLLFLALLIFAVVTLWNTVSFLITCDWVGNITDSEMNHTMLGLLIAALSLGVGIFSLIMLIKRIGEIRRCGSSIQKYVVDIQNLNEFLSKLPFLQNYIQGERAKKAKEIGPIVEACGELYLSLQKMYARTIDERDWQHVDLVIYYMETYRADSMKEALQLVERETQTQRIIQAVEQATERICGTLRQGFAAINSTINNLSAQLRASQRLQSMQYANLTAAVNLNNALQAKANVSSAKLVSEVSSLRANSDYTTMRLKQI